MSFTNPNETWEEAEARWQKNRTEAIEKESDPEKRVELIKADTMARMNCEFAKLFGRSEQ